MQEESHGRASLWILETTGGSRVELATTEEEARRHAQRKEPDVRITHVRRIEVDIDAA